MQEIAALHKQLQMEQLQKDVDISERQVNYKIL